MNEIITLIYRTPGTDTITKRDVFCRVASIGQAEFYQSYAVDVHPEAKFILADYLEYNGETLADYNGKRYSILRTYRTGQELELTVAQASEEEAEL